MILSRDHTWLRLAALPDSVIERFLAKDYPGLITWREPMTVRDVRDIEAAFATVVPGKEDLATQWFLASVLSRGEGTYIHLDLYKGEVAWFFEHQKEPLFRQVVAEYAERKKRTINPKNLMDFTGYDLQNVHGTYEEQEKAININKLPETLPEGAKLVYNDGSHQIVEVSEVDAACELGQGSRWCTREEPDATKYLDIDPLYIIYRGGQKFAQLHMGPGYDEWTGIQLMNLKNREMEPDEALRKVLVSSGLMNGILNTINAAEGTVSQFVRFIGKKDNPRVRAVCAREPYLTYLYAAYVLHDRFLDGERVLAKESPEWAVEYAQDVIKGRFLEAEDEIIEQGYDDVYANMLQKVNPAQHAEFLKYVQESSDEGRSSW